MLVEGLCNLGLVVLNAVLDLLDVLPDMPQVIISAVNAFVDLIFQGISILNFFIPVSYLGAFVLIAIAIENFEKVYSFVMWVLRKIPFVGIE